MIPQQNDHYLSSFIYSFVFVFEGYFFLTRLLFSSILSFAVEKIGYFLKASNQVNSCSSPALLWTTGQLPCKTQELSNSNPLGFLRNELFKCPHQFSSIFKPLIRLQSLIPVGWGIAFSPPPTWTEVRNPRHPNICVNFFLQSLVLKQKKSSPRYQKSQNKHKFLVIQ